MLSAKALEKWARAILREVSEEEQAALLARFFGRECTI